MARHFEPLLAQLASAVGAQPEPKAISVAAIEPGAALPSAFAVTDLAAASMANAAAAARRVAALHGGDIDAAITIDPRLASLWFGTTIAPVDWELPPIWDSIAGIYACGERSVRLHTNAPHHKAAALKVLGCEETRERVAAAVGRWDAFELETAVVEAGGVASALRSRDEWVAHPQGTALQTEPLVHHTTHPTTFDATAKGGSARQEAEQPSVERPLAGVRVLDLTRVLAGPVATRLLAGFGADVLRIDPPIWDEAGVAMEVNLGKRCARLDLREPGDRAAFEALLAEADIMLHGYRRDALAGLGYDEAARRALNPGLVDVSLNAWGHTGPWRDRRGFDSITQIAAGVAHHGMVAFGTDAAKPLPVQALDHATGYTLAACALRGWADRLEQGTGSTWKTALAAHAELLWPTASDEHVDAVFEPLGEDDLAPGVEDTSWGPVRRAATPLTIDGTPLHWPNGAANHGTSPANWRNDGDR